MRSKKGHLPLVGVGPVIVFGQIVMTAIAIQLSYKNNWNYLQFGIFNIPLKIIGCILISFGLYLDYSAKKKSKLFQHIAENKLITDGVYSIVRNPVYGGALLMCAGAVCITNKLFLFGVIVICWIYMTILLINTEERWLRDLYGQEYIDYCRKVNRCIPWFSDNTSNKRKGRNSK